eukprot:11075-Heterococcus_DN1.PRE.2
MMNSGRPRLCLWNAVREHDEAAVALLLETANGQKQLTGKLHLQLVAFRMILTIIWQKAAAPVAHMVIWPPSLA